MSASGLGHFTKAVGKGMGGPCFRIFQAHFASQNNVGDVAAKEQVNSGSEWSKYGKACNKVLHSIKFSGPL